MTLILLGKILSPHGVRGQMKVASYASLPSNLISYGPLFDKTGARRFNLTLEGQVKNALIASIEGVTTREEAEKLRNIELYVPRSALPPTEQGQYYQNDLIGLPVVTESGDIFGTLIAFHNFGAGTLAEIRLEGKRTELYPFTAATFPLIDVENKKLMIHPPEEIE